MSATSRPVKEEALVIRSIRHGESSRIVTLFGRSLGKFAVIAKGARRGKGGAAGSAVEPVNLVEAVVYLKPGRGVQTLGQISVLEGYNRLKHNLEFNGYAAAVIEHLNRSFTDGEPNQEAYNAAVTALQRLEQGTGDARVVLWRFQLSLFRAIGFALDPLACPTCGRESADIGVRNLFWLEAGAVCCHGCQPQSGTAIPLSGESVRILRLLAASDDSAIGRLKPSLLARRELTGALVRFLKHHHPGIGSLPTIELIDRLGALADKLEQPPEPENKSKGNRK